MANEIVNKCLATETSEISVCSAANYTNFLC